MLHMLRECEAIRTDMQIDEFIYEEKGKEK